ncbi:hypothetical protein AAE478_001932 [Parahypoxylon ruwenzoriense]
MSSTDGSTFKHTPLLSKTSIRLLTILPDSGRPIRCSVSVAELQREITYDCLSYTWGDPLYRGLSLPGDRNDDRYSNQNLFPESIECNGKSSPVGQNLFDALLRLRSSGYGNANCPIWIDAICIDQGNIPEKNDQVAMMGHIYESARSVIIWLGPDDVYTDAAIDVMNRLASVPEAHTRARFTDLMGDDVSEQLKINPAISRQEWLCYAASLQRHWFTRIWVVQEACLAKQITVFFGSKEVSWSSLMACARLLEKTNLANLLADLIIREQNALTNKTTPFDKSILSSGVNNQYIYTVLKGETKARITLEKILSYSRYFNAGDERDHVFGIKGIWEKTNDVTTTMQEYMKPEYDMRMKLDLVFTNATYASICETGDLNIFRLVEHVPHWSQRLETLPSWVPDYRQKPQLQPIATRPGQGQNKKRWDASAELTWELPPFSKGQKHLIVRGFQIDIVDEAGPSMLETMEQFAILDLLNILFHYPSLTYPDGSNYFDSFWRTLIKDTFRDISADNEAREAFHCLILKLYWELKFISQLATNPVNHGVIPSLDRIQELKSIYDQDDNSPERIRLDDIYDDFEKPFKEAFSHRRFFRTRHKYFGITAESLRTSDSVWILAGADAPYVLRHAGDTDNSWRIVGEAYVHGMMNGEALKGDIQLGELRLV